MLLMNRDNDIYRLTHSVVQWHLVHFPSPPLALLSPPLSASVSNRTLPLFIYSHLSICMYVCLFVCLIVYLCVYLSSHMAKQHYICLLISLSFRVNCHCLFANKICFPSDRSSCLSSLNRVCVWGGGETVRLCVR